MKVGLVGAGHIAAVHVLAIRAHPGAEIVGVADAFEEYAKLFAQEHEIPEGYGSVGEMIAKAKPDVVHILTPPGTHRSVALECLEAGCHVLIEKPMTVDPQDAQDLIEAANRHGKLISVNHNCRFEPTVARARKMIDEGRIGDVVTVEVDFGFNINRYPAILQEGATDSHWCYKLNGGPLQDQMPHPLSMVLEYLGEIRDVKFVSCNRGKVPTPWDDEIRVSIVGQNAHAELYCSFSHRPDAMVFTARGTGGTVIADMHSMVCAIDRDSPLPRGLVRLGSGFTRSWQQCKGAIANIFRVLTGRMDKTNGVSGVVCGFYEAIEAGNAPAVTMDEGKRVVDLIKQIWPEPLRQPRPVEDPPVVARGNPTVLVTGATGFVGIHLVKGLLERGESVRALARPSSYGLGQLKRLGVEVMYGDLSNPQAVDQAMQGIETVYHVGGAMAGGWTTHQAATIDGTRNVLNSARKSKCRRVVYYSSLAVYNVLAYEKDGVIDEQSELQKQPERFGPYAWGKIAAEQLINQAQVDGLSTTIIRPGIIIGPEGCLFFPHLGFVFQDRVFLTISGGRLQLPLVYIDNLVEGTIAAANSESADGKIYNIIDDGNIRVCDYVERFNRRTGIGAKVISLPFLVPWGAALAYEIVSGIGLLKKGATSRIQMRWKHKRVKFSNEAAKRDFGYKTNVPIEEGMDRTFDWYISQRK